MDETRIERALRQGPPYRTQYVPHALPISAEGSVRHGAAAARRMLLLVAVLALLLSLALGSALIGSGILKLPVSVEARAASWSATGSMTERRQVQTATLLADGKVLVVGGYDDRFRARASAELYDPVSGLWTPTGSMHEGRYWHTATLLPDGRVLVSGGTGGASGGRLRASAELYDPVSGTWSTTGSLFDARAQHSATLLLDGTVLITGGERASSDDLVASTELYNPSTGSWTMTGPLREARFHHTATLLPDGTVLVAGGTGQTLDRETFPSLTSAELYQPSTGTWTSAAGMSEGRSSHTAILLRDGTVLLTGGYATYGGLVASAELYDPGTGSWTAAGQLVFAAETATLLPNGMVLVIGGDGSGQSSGSAHLYDPIAGTWAKTADLISERGAYTATLLSDGRVLLAGGTRGAAVLATADLYDPGSDS